ncbi:MAG TPA: YhbY family RNA-binding protein [Chthoniobacteraceae bacterium]|jgi:RNA-binding protein|nr:YhbY family RNA-binding protein [Chthoniobacteraceae bacterium]
MTPLTNAKKRQLKARAQKLEPVLKIGHGGVTPAFLASLEEALNTHELVKIRFADFKEEKKTLAPQIAEQSGSELIMRVGNVAVYYRPGAKT